MKKEKITNRKNRTSKKMMIEQYQSNLKQNNVNFIKKELVKKVMIVLFLMILSKKL